MATVALVLALTLVPLRATADINVKDINVQFAEGVNHGFLVLRPAGGGEPLAYGELLQTPTGTTIDSRLIFRFTDRSLYDEKVTYSQAGVLRLLKYHLVQHGPAFPAVKNVAFDRASGRYRIDGKDAGPFAVPDDLHNGMTLVLLKNLPAGQTATGQMVDFRPGPELLTTTLKAEGTEPYVVGAAPGSATKYLITMKVQGALGLRNLGAGLIGKAPPDLRYWLTRGPAAQADPPHPPGFVRFEGAMFLNGPIWRIELSAPRWTPAH